MISTIDSFSIINELCLKLDAKSVPEALATTILILLKFSIDLAHRQNPGASAHPAPSDTPHPHPIRTPSAPHPPPQAPHPPPRLFFGDPHDLGIRGSISVGHLLTPPKNRIPLSYGVYPPWQNVAGRTSKVKNVFCLRIDAKSIPEALETTILILQKFSIDLVHRQNPGASAHPAPSSAHPAPSDTPHPHPIRTPSAPHPPP